MKAFINYSTVITIYCLIDFILNYFKQTNSIKINYHLNLVILNFEIRFDLINC